MHCIVYRACRQQQQGIRNAAPVSATTWGPSLVKTICLQMRKLVLRIVFTSIISSMMDGLSVSYLIRWEYEQEILVKWSALCWCDQLNIFDSPIIARIRGINYRVVRNELSIDYVDLMIDTELVVKCFLFTTSPLAIDVMLRNHKHSNYTPSHLSNSNCIAPFKKYPLVLWLDKFRSLASISIHQFLISYKFPWPRGWVAVQWESRSGECSSSIWSRFREFETTRNKVLTEYWSR